MITIASIFTACFMLMAFAACDDKNEEPATDNTTKEDVFMKEIFGNLTSNGNYTEWKQMNPEAKIEEKLDGSKIIFTVATESESEEEEDITNDRSVLAGEYVFTHDDDYIVYTAQDADHMSNAFLTLVRNTVLDYYKVDTIAANEYLAKMLSSGEESIYYIEDAANNTVKMYAAGKWEID